MPDSLIVNEWTVIPRGHSLFQRIYDIRRSSPLEVEYLTQEKRGGRYVDVTYKAVVLEGYVAHRWSLDKEKWTAYGKVLVTLLKEDGTEYQSGWRAGWVSVDTFAVRGREMRPDIHTFLDEIIEATRPQTKITITEEPVNG